jgi:hypothetical protein
MRRRRVGIKRPREEGGLRQTVAPAALEPGTRVPIGEDHDGSFGVYMSHKMQKQARQFDANAA